MCVQRSRYSPQARRLNAVKRSLEATCTILATLSLYAAVTANPYRPRSCKKLKDLRLNWNFASANRVLNDFEFARTYRMERKTFQILLFLAKERLSRNKEMARRAGRQVVSAEARLGILLRMMAGNSVYSCMSAFEVGRSTAYQVFRETRDELNEMLDLPGLPETFHGLETLSNSFQTSRCPPNPLPGCVGALDGIAIRIKKPSKDEHPAIFYCRKGFYAIPVQALVDSNYRFLCFSAKCRGSTHDSLAHAVSSFCRYLESGKLSVIFWIAGDEAYVCTEYLITPVPASQASDTEDEFNFYHSSLRKHVEQSFGMLMKKFPILKRLEFSVNDSAETIGLAMKLHNFCLDHGDKAKHRVGRSGARRALGRRILVQSRGWYEEGKHEYFEMVGRRGGAVSKKRELLIKIISDGGYVRPATVPLSAPAFMFNAPGGDSSSLVA